MSQPSIQTVRLTMRSAQRLREFVQQRLAAAAEEIFTEFEKTIVRCEAETERQRGPLDPSCGARVKLHAADLPQQHVCKEEEENLTDQQLCNQQNNSSLNQEEPKPPQTKEEQEELCTSQEGEQLELKEETDTFMVTVTYEESDQREPEPQADQILSCSSDTFMSVQSQPKEALEVNNNPVQYKEEIGHQCGQLNVTWKPEVKLHRLDLPQQHVYKEEEEEDLTDQQLCNQKSNSSLNQEEPELPQTKEEQELCTSQEGEQLVLEEETDTPNVESDQREPEPNTDQLRSHSSPVGSTRKRKKSHSNNAEDSLMSENQSDSDRSKKSLKCEICEKPFQDQNQMNEHHRIHKGRKLYSCKTCGKSFNRRGNLIAHIRIHTSEKPHSCKTCGKMFKHNGTLLIHERTHMGERPYPYKTCGIKFMRSSHLLEHIRTHTGERPYSCKTCGKMFKYHSTLLEHIRTHTGERPYSCKTCGKMFRRSSHLLEHTGTHTGEKPYPCKTCGKTFSRNRDLFRHMKTHKSQKPTS